MTFVYKDEKIPKRPSQGGDSSRSFSAAQDSRWEMISQEELFTGRTVQKAGASSGKALEEQFLAGANGGVKDGAGTDGGRSETLFSRLIRMKNDYQHTEDGRKEAFLAQARLMEAYTEDGYISVEDQYHSYVGYQEMTTRELHEYFAWRTRFRREGKAPLRFDFIQLHAAELINLVGAGTQQDAFNKLLKLVYMAKYPGEIHEDRKTRASRAGLYASGVLKTYGAWGAAGGRRTLMETEIRRLDKIVSDFVISWGPDPEIVAEYAMGDIASERDKMTLLDPESTDDAGIYLAISHLADRRKLSSMFLEEAGEDAWRVMARVFRRLCREQGAASGTASKSASGTASESVSGTALEPASGTASESASGTLAMRLLGKRRTVPARLFLWIPYEPRAREGDTVTISPATSYRFQKGEWQKDSFAILRDDAALRELNKIVRECERVLRMKMHYRNNLPDKLHDKALVRLIGEEYDRWIEEKAVRDRPKIQVDLSKLRAIREQAAITRERLLEGTQEGELSQESGLSQAMNAFVEESALDREDLTEVPVGDADRPTEFAGKEAKSAGRQTEFTGRGAESADGGAKSTEPANVQEADAEIRSVPVQSGTQARTEDGIFQPKERVFLELLLAGDNGKDYFRENKMMASVFIDAINEKAYEEIGDSIVEEGNGGWCLVEDYIEDVRALLE